MMVIARRRGEVDSVTKMMKNVGFIELNAAGLTHATSRPAVVVWPEGA
jgi:hypothetical protein